MKLSKGIYLDMQFKIMVTHVLTKPERKNRWTWWGHQQRERNRNKRPIKASLSTEQLKRKIPSWDPMSDERMQNGPIARTTGWRGHPSWQQTERVLVKHEDGLSDVYQNIKHTDICTTGALEGEGTEFCVNSSGEGIAWNFPNPWNKTDTWAQESQRTPNRRKPRRPHQDPLTLSICKAQDREP